MTDSNTIIIHTPNGLVILDTPEKRVQAYHLIVSGGGKAVVRG